MCESHSCPRTDAETQQVLTGELLLETLILLPECCGREIDSRRLKEGEDLNHSCDFHQQLNGHKLIFLPDETEIYNTFLFYTAINL